MSQRLYFTRNEILKGRDKQAPLTPEMEQNLTRLIEAASVVREAFGKVLHVSSGYRPASINQSVGGAAKSAHQSCEAVDLVDTDGFFANWCLNNLDILEKAGLYLEDPRYTGIFNSKGERTGGWTHLQTRPTSRRIFIPYAGVMKVQIR